MGGAGLSKLLLKSLLSEAILFFSKTKLMGPGNNEAGGVVFEADGGGVVAVTVGGEVFVDVGVFAPVDDMISSV